MVMYFRCFNCWRQLGYNGVKDYMVCPGCDARLFVGKPEGETVKISVSAISEHIQRLQKLHELLAKDKETYRGKPEIIAGETARYTPDAVYYDRNDTGMRQPIIYQVTACDSMFSEDIINRCRLFSKTAEDLFSTFYVIVPTHCGEKNGEELVHRMLDEYKIEGADIIIL
ncbi:MAG: hypothetical protein WBB67_05890 [bacterium]